MKLRISLLTILIGMLFASCGLSTGKVAEQKEEGISVLRYDKLLSEYVRSNSFSAMQKLTMDYRQPTKILIEASGTPITASKRQESLVHTDAAKESGDTEVTGHVQV